MYDRGRERERKKNVIIKIGIILIPFLSAFGMVKRKKNKTIQ